MLALSGRWALLTHLDALSTLELVTLVNLYGRFPGSFEARRTFTDRCKNAVYISSAINGLGKAPFSTFSIDAQFYRQASGLITRRF